MYGIIHQYLMQDCKEKAVRLFDAVIENGVEADKSVYFQTKQQRAYLLSQIGYWNSGLLWNTIINYMRRKCNGYDVCK